jgi:hypothetical protein
MKKIIYLLLVAVLSNCTPPSDPYFDAVLTNREGLFRGVEIKDGNAAVKKQEQSAYLKVDEQVFLKYVYPFHPEKEEEDRYELEYYFDGEDQLHEVVMDIFIRDKQSANELYEKLKKHYTRIYGEGKKNKEGYVVWKGKTANTNRLEVALINDSENSESTGYLSLQLNDFDY